MPHKKGKPRGKYNIKQKYQILTIEPTPCNIKTIRDIIKKVRKKSYITVYYYSISQQGTTLETLGTDKYAQLIIKKNKMQN